MGEINEGRRKFGLGVLGVGASLLSGCARPDWSEILKPYELPELSVSDLLKQMESKEPLKSNEFKFRAHMKYVGEGRYIYYTDYSTLKGMLPFSGNIYQAFENPSLEGPSVWVFESVSQYSQPMGGADLLPKNSKGNASELILLGRSIGYDLFLKEDESERVVSNLFMSLTQVDTPKTQE